MADNLKYLNEVNNILDAYNKLVGIENRNIIPDLQAIIKRIDSVGSKITDADIKNRLLEVRTNAQDIIASINAIAPLGQELERTWNLLGGNNLYTLYRRKVKTVLYTKLNTLQKQFDYTTDLNSYNKLLGNGINWNEASKISELLNKLEEVVNKTFTTGNIDENIIKLSQENNTLDKKGLEKVLYDKLSNQFQSDVEELEKFVKDIQQETREKALPLQNKLQTLRKKGEEISKRIEEVAEKKEQSTNQTVKKELEKIENKEIKNKDKVETKKQEKKDKIDKLPKGDKNSFETSKTPVIKKSNDANQVIPTKLEQINPPVSVSETKALSGQNPLGNLFGDTQLLEGDILDPRKIDLFIPGYYTDKLPAYMSIIYSGESPLTNVGITNNLPTLDAPFKIGNQKAVYNQFFLTRTYESYNEKQQLVDTMSEGNVAFFFGRAPEVWTFSGQLINDKLHAWHAKMREIWQNNLRGSILAKQNAFLSIVVPSNMLQVNCYPIALNIEHNTSSENLSMFSMSVIVKNSRTLPGLVSRNTAKGNTEKLSPFETMIKIAEFLNKMQKGAV